MSYQEQGGGGESVVVNGTVEGVEVKPNGRYVVKVREVGSASQYALNLNTKDVGVAQQMMQAVGQGFSFICGLSHWVNQSNQPVTSKWINGVAPLQGGMQPQAQPMQQQPQGQWSGAAQPQQQQVPQPMQQVQPQNWAQAQPQPRQEERPTDDPYIRRVSWLAAVPAAVAALDHLPEDQRTVAALVKMTDFLAKTAILRGQQGFVQASEYNPQPGHDGAPGGGSDYHPGYAAQGAYGDPGPSDDDIPF